MVQFVTSLVDEVTTYVVFEKDDSSHGEDVVGQHHDHL